jgi:hypothetical protein
MHKKLLIIIVTGGSDNLFAKKNANPFDKVSIGLTGQSYGDDLFCIYGGSLTTITKFDFETAITL